MKNHRLIIGSFLISAAIWCVVAWPLPLFLNKGIPMAHHGGADMSVRNMEPGDHLQLLYYCWLFSDMVRGQTPWMFNPYEFHTGDEEARHIPDPYYAPFSWIYTVFALGGHRAFAWNMTGLMSIWLTYLFTLLLLRRYIAQPWIVAAASLIAILLPYRWFALLGGSPTGLAMMLTPILMWGLHRAIREGSVAGGVWAAAAIVFSFTSDLHVFFFNVLLTPIWCALVWVAHPNFQWRTFADYRRVALALLPVVIGLGAVLFYSQSVAGALGETDMAGGRSIHEVRLFSPNRDGLFGWQEHPVASQVYLGVTLVLVLLIGGITMAWRWLIQRSMSWRESIFYGLLIGLLGLLALLALGPHAPRDARLFHWVREWIPHYDMIRQTGKIYALMPPLLALAAGLSLAALRDACPIPRLRVLCVALPLLLIGAEYVRRIHPPICLLATEEPAYAAVAHDADERGIRPHAFIVTLWPGDAHYASLYQYYCSLYRIRMINGYNPAVDQTYYETIFLPFQTINQGWLTNEQADDLLSRGIEYIIVHANHFPEKVSPFPIAHTLHAFRNHERLSLLEQSGPIWAFRILDASSARPDPAVYPPPPVLMPARHWLFQRQPNILGHVEADDTAARGQYLALREPSASVQAADSEAPPAEDRRWMFRARGQGTLSAQSRVDGVTAHEIELEVDTTAWTWFSVSATDTGYAHLALDLTLADGAIDLCSTLLTAGRDLNLEAGDAPITLPPSAFFHAGHLEMETGHVVFRKDRDWSGAVFYGPKLPLGRGTFTVEVLHQTDAPDGQVLGFIEVEQIFNPHFARPRQPVMAQQPTALTFTLSENLPINVIFVYDANADLRLTSVSFTAAR